MATAYIGTSGFSYPHWKGEFYPQDLPQSKWFEFYCRHFNTVELNVSFYRLPKKETFVGWRETAGAACLPAGRGFVFAVKGNRYITHVKKLKDCQEAVERLFEAASGLEKGPGAHRSANRRMMGSPRLSLLPNVILWQLPPNFKVNVERLSGFLTHLRGGVAPQSDVAGKSDLPPAAHLGGVWRSSQTRQPRLTWRHAFEFRDESWLCREVYRLLREYSAAVVFQDFPDWPITEGVTADFVYLRFHGKTGLYSSCYTEKELREWARKIRKWHKRDLDIYAFFNNDALGYATENAKRLKQLLNANS